MRCTLSRELLLCNQGIERRKRGGRQKKDSLDARRCFYSIRSFLSIEHPSTSVIARAVDSLLFSLAFGTMKLPVKNKIVALQN